jgi:hypothetical protein
MQFYSTIVKLFFKYTYVEASGLQLDQINPGTV